MKLGIDVDGVLADFNSAFIRRIIDVTGRDLFPRRPFDIPTWNYPEHYGYTIAEVTRVWETIKADGFFWRNLPVYPDTARFMELLSDRIRTCEDDVYFITARLGFDAKGQTESWLRSQLSCLLYRPNPTVLITSHKGLAARTLELDVYIDDRWENALDVSMTKTRSYLLTRPWNTHIDSSNIIRIASVFDFVPGPRLNTSRQVA